MDIGDCEDEEDGWNRSEGCTCWGYRGRSCERGGLERLREGFRCGVLGANMMGISAISSM